jgi:hypothetical protein
MAEHIVLRATKQIAARPWLKDMTSDTSRLKHKEQIIIQRTWKGKWYYICTFFKLNTWSDMNCQWQYTKYWYNQHRRNIALDKEDYYNWLLWDVSKHVRYDRTVQTEFISHISLCRNMATLNICVTAHSTVSVVHGQHSKSVFLFMCSFNDVWICRIPVCWILWEGWKEWQVKLINWCKQYLEMQQLAEHLFLNASIILNTIKCLLKVKSILNIIQSIETTNHTPRHMTE